MSGFKGQYRGTCKPDDQFAYVFVRFGESLYQKAKNDLTKRLSIHPNYTGKVLGVARQVIQLEGESNFCGKCMVVLKFECMCEAQKWFECTPDIKQQDWLDGCDIVAVPARSVAESNKPWVELLDMNFIDYDRFCHDYVVQAQDYLQRTNATLGVVASDCPKTYRGLWNPHHIIMNQFSSEEDFKRAYEADEYQHLKQKRQCTSRSDVILFRLEPLC